MEISMSRKKEYVVRLTGRQRRQLRAIMSAGAANAHRIQHAHILLKDDAHGADWSDQRIAEAVGCHPGTVASVRQRFAEQGLEAALDRKKQDRPSREPKLDGEGEARLIAIACSQPPEGRDHWSLKLLADRLVQLEVVDSISTNTVQRRLKKTNCGRMCTSSGSSHRRRTGNS